MMKQDLLDALTRWSGVIIITYGIYTLAYELLRNVLPDLPHKLSIANGLVFASLEVLLGFALLMGGGLLVRLVYGPQMSD